MGCGLLTGVLAGHLPTVSPCTHTKRSRGTPRALSCVLDVQEALCPLKPGRVQLEHVWGRVWTKARHLSSPVNLPHGAGALAKAAMRV